MKVSVIIGVCAMFATVCALVPPDATTDALLKKIVDAYKPHIHPHDVLHKADTIVSVKNIVKGTEVKGKLLATPAKEIFLGILEGMETDVGNLTECLKDTDDGIEDIDQFVLLLDHGIRSRNKTEIAEAFPYLAKALRVLSSGARVCGVIKVAEDVDKIIEELEVPGGWLKVLKDEGFKIFVHFRDVTKDLFDAVGDYKAMQWNAFGQDVGRILGYLL
eukprot:TRINITY_DN34_c0_g1_i1.p1 TRINITY_DN34_c0_g1~~TRINITY_DN34_c0_g1_i1.p1  ORF type:complete len:218 (-),score=61.93 TRINITY_DN34_c0_g1_i1:302-955(-)